MHARAHPSHLKAFLMHQHLLAQVLMFLTHDPEHTGSAGGV